jgi:hypothetical protein
MNVTSKFNVGDIVYVKDENRAVFVAKIVGIKFSSTESERFRFMYDLWRSDRRDWAGHSDSAYEGNMALTFDEAYYDRNPQFPWSIKDKKYKKFPENAE